MQNRKMDALCLCKYFMGRWREELEQGRLLTSPDEPGSPPKSDDQQVSIIDRKTHTAEKSPFWWEKKKKQQQASVQGGEVGTP